jgi:hypothetical protein
MSLPCVMFQLLSLMLSLMRFRSGMPARQGPNERLRSCSGSSSDESSDVSSDSGGNEEPVTSSIVRNRKRKRTRQTSVSGKARGRPRKVQKHTMKTEQSSSSSDTDTVASEPHCHDDLDTGRHQSNASTLKTETLELLEWDEELRFNGKILSQGSVLDVAVEHKELLSALNEQNPRGKHLLKCQTTRRRDELGSVTLMRVECAHTRTKVKAKRRINGSSICCGVCGKCVADSRALLEHQQDHSMADLKLVHSQVKVELKKSGSVKIRSKRCACSMFISVERSQTVDGRWSWTVKKLQLHHSNHPKYVGVKVGRLRAQDLSELVTRTVDEQLPHKSIHLAAQSLAGGYVPKVQVSQVLRKSNTLKEKRLLEESLEQLREFSPSQEMLQAVRNNKCLQDCRHGTRRHTCTGTTKSSRFPLRPFLGASEAVAAPRSTVSLCC